MNKNEYLARVFQSQVTSLANSISTQERYIKDLEGELEQCKLDLAGDRENLKYAENELKKVT